MPVKHTHKASEVEKRLKALESQLYGKQIQPIINTGLKEKISSVSESNAIKSSSSDILYLKKDLLKITILAGFAISIQFIIYYLHLIDRIKIF